MNIAGFIVISLLLICTIALFVILAVAWKKHKSPDELVKDHIKLIYEERAQPSDYVNTFEHSHSGRKVLEQLIMVFDQSAFVKGGADAERETTFKLGQKSVIEFIAYALAQAKKPKNDEVEEDE